jgi:hypothetical protein
LCKRSEPYRLRFGDASSTLFWCRSCLRKYTARERSLVLPWQESTLRIDSLYGGFCTDDLLLEGLWMKAEKLLKTALSQPSSTTVILWYDAIVDYTAPIWLRMLRGMGDLYVFSLFEIDPLRWLKDDS